MSGSKTKLLREYYRLEGGTERGFRRYKKNYHNWKQNEQI